MQPMKLLRSPTLWGAGALAFGAIMALVAAMLYINPPARVELTFYTTDAATIQPGDQVRIAGINVGTVKDLQLEDQQVRVRALVEDAAFVGDQSQIQVRMLTVVGGYYVNIVSLGANPIGMKPIPLERVTMPYNLMRTLADVPKITDNVDPVQIQESLNQVQSGLAGDNVESITAIIDAGNAVMGAVDQQRGQITQILNLSDEYILALSNYTDQLKALVRKISILEQTLAIYSEGFGSSLEGLGDALDGLSPVAIFYTNHREDFLEKVRNWVKKATYWSERNGVIVRSLRLIHGKIERVLDAQNAPPEFLATDLCMPVPGKAC